MVTLFLPLLLGCSAIADLSSVTESRKITWPSRNIMMLKSYDLLIASVNTYIFFIFRTARQDGKI